ncbi:MAG: hypothetical protein A2498_13530 [Lentisphaerae bacterium RIFOXYC12_FULL_60_16]|nr:MAG: hypothetical protein A2498_13530 [Lentisphaerae bacterium RIFOXYC12_FULL_60_16]
MKYLCIILAVLFQGFVPLVSARETWREIATPRYPTGNLEFPVDWTPARGLSLRILEAGSDRMVQFDIRPDRGAIRVSPEKTFPPALEASSQFQLEALPDKPASGATLLVKFRPANWSLYLAGRPIAVIPAPFQPPLTVQALSTLTTADKETVRYQKVADFHFTHDFLLPDNETNLPSVWTPWSGDWKLHSAADTAVELERLKAEAGEKPKLEHSPNFYTLKGRGTNACILTGYDFYDTYILQAAMLTQPGEMGLVFAARPESGYFAFTVRMAGNQHRGRLELWKTPSTNPVERTILAAVETELTPGQWIRLGAVMHANRIRCLLDGFPVLDIPVELPAGGQFGLYINSDVGTLFDDVDARTHHDLDFLGLNDVRRHVLLEDGDFFPRRRFFRLFAPREPGSFLKIPERETPQRLILGSVLHPGHVMQASFLPKDPNRHEAGLIAGWTPSRAGYHFIRQASPTGLVYRLDQVSSNDVRTLETLPLPPPPSNAPASFTLMADGSNPDFLRLYCNDELVLLHRLQQPADGASGIWIGPQTAASVSNFVYRSDRDDIHRNLFEKNRLYVEDPFMRHWSSPEGQWLQDTNGLNWFKGDLFGRFAVRLPWIPGSELYPGIPEGATTGTYRIRSTTNGLNLEGIDGVILAQGLTNRLAWEVPPTAQNPTNTPPQPWFSIEHEGYWLTGISGTNILFKHPLPQPRMGRRMRVAGFTPDQLKHSLVDVYNIQDCLFTESLHGWIQNGGIWDVVNRFQCQPRWSHMNGESTDGLAALWNKFRFSGDFCVEIHAGMRHGWYERCGDLNLTMHADTTSPGSGYSVTLTGWDPDLSQRYSRLYRNGAEMAVSEQYLAPRIREGNYRLYTDPLVPQGRDTHGAWYYIKFRKVGNHLQYLFDNVPVFDVEDPAPRDGGRFGLWTFKNSIMVARVKVAAEQIERVPPRFHPVEPDAPFPAATPASLPPDIAGILKDQLPLIFTTTHSWQINDTVGYSVLREHSTPRDGPYLEVVNLLGSGPMHLAPTNPPPPYPWLAGWRFDLKRTPGARFNFYFSLGRMVKDKGYQPEWQFMYRISGDPSPGGLLRETGSGDIPPVATPTSDWHRDGTWTPVTVWLPTDPEWRHLLDNTNYLVRVDGFGSLHSGLSVQGLTGNEPGAAYAIRRFTDIRYTPPVLTVSTQAVANPDLSWSVNQPEPAPAQRGTISNFTAWAAAQSNAGLHAIMLSVHSGLDTVHQPVAWIQLPDQPQTSLAWSSQETDTLLLSGPDSYPDRRISTATLSLGNGQPEPIQWTGIVRRAWSIPRSGAIPIPQGMNRFKFRIPAPERLQTLHPDSLPILLQINQIPSTNHMAWPATASNRIPRLVRLSSPSFFLETFETRWAPPELNASEANRIPDPDPRQGYHLLVANNGKPLRLNTTWNFPTPINLSQFPIVQFRYRTHGMAFISVTLNQQHVLRVSESFDQALPSRQATPFTPDGQWRAWNGMVVDAFGKTPMNLKWFAARHLAWGSRHGVDQTGRFTQMEVDDIVLGPAVSRPSQLLVEPVYTHPSGIRAVMTAILPGRATYDDLPPEQAKALAWKEWPVEKPIIPDLPATLPDGPGQLLLRAVAGNGAESPVTSLPFLLDRKPPAVTSQVIPTNSLIHNESIVQITLGAGDGAPVDFGNLTFKWNDQPVSLPPPLGTDMSHTPTTDYLTLNWPHLFRESIDATSTNGATNWMVVTGIRDGAGNAAPDIRMPWITDYARDTTPPTLLAPTLPSNILWNSGWEFASANQPFTSKHGGRIQVINPTNDEPYLETITVKKSAVITLNLTAKKWWIRDFPLLAFRVRQPQGSTGGTALVEINLQFDKERIYPISLTERPTRRRQKKLFLAEPIVWRSNTWHSVLLDLEAFLEENLEPKQQEMVLGPADAKERKEKKTLQATSLDFRITNAPESAPIQFQSMFIFRPFGTQDVVRMNAFDVSGIAGVSWKYEQAEYTTALSPATLLQGGQADNGWLLMQVRDKAGNLSGPFRIPRNQPAEPPAAPPEPDAPKPGEPAP